MSFIIDGRGWTPFATSPYKRSKYTDGVIPTPDGDFLAARNESVSAPPSSLNVFTLNTTYSDTTALPGQVIHANITSGGTFPGVTNPETELAILTNWDLEGLDVSGNTATKIPASFVHSRDTRVTQGWIAKRAYATPGSYTAINYASKLSAGNVVSFGTHTQTITILDPDVVIPAANTYVITGTSVETQPANNGVFATIKDFLDAVNLTGSNGFIRLRFARGVQHFHSEDITISRILRSWDFYCDGYGTGSDPEIIVNHFNPIRVFSLKLCPRATFFGIKITGGYDPEIGAGAGEGATGIYAEDVDKLSVYRCELDGLDTLIRDLGISNSATNHNVCYDCKGTNWNNFGRLASTRSQYAGMLFCDFSQNPLARSGGGGKNDYRSEHIGDGTTTVFSLDITGITAPSDTGLIAADYIVYQYDDESGYLRTEITSGITINPSSPTATLTFDSPPAGGYKFSFEYRSWADHGGYRSPADYEGVYWKNIFVSRNGWSTPPGGIQAAIRLLTGLTTTSANSLQGQSLYLGCNYLEGGNEIIQVATANDSNIYPSPALAIIEANYAVGDARTWQWFRGEYSGCVIRNNIVRQSLNNAPGSVAFRAILALSQGSLAVNGNSTGNNIYKGNTVLNLQPNPGATSDGITWNGTDFDAIYDMGGANLENSTINGVAFSSFDVTDLEVGQNLTYAPNVNNSSAARLAVDPLLTDINNDNFIPGSSSYAIESTVDNTDPHLFDTFSGYLRPKIVLGAENRRAFL